jgi:hypothetical protein
MVKVDTPPLTGLSFSLKWFQLEPCTKEASYAKIGCKWNHAGSICNPRSGEPNLDTTTLDFAERVRPKRGRDARGQSLATRFTKAEEDELATAASEEGKTLREWSREVLLREARRSKDDPLFTEVVALRMLLNNVLGPIAAGHKLSQEEFGAIMANVRTGKRDASREVLRQYSEAAQKGL